MLLTRLTIHQSKLFLEDTESSPETTLKSARELEELGIKIIIGPVFNENLAYLNQLQGVTFLSLTNKNNNESRNIINAGINATSQLKAIKNS